MRQPITLLALGAVLLTAGAAVAQGGHACAAQEPPQQPRSEMATARYPQPVLVRDLLGRQVLENVPQQHVLGRVAGVVRVGDDNIAILVESAGLFGFGPRRVVVPVEATALLGPFAVALELNSRKLAALPEAPAAPGIALPANATIRIGLARN